MAARGDFFLCFAVLKRLPEARKQSRDLFSRLRRRRCQLRDNRPPVFQAMPIELDLRKVGRCQVDRGLHVTQLACEEPGHIGFAATRFASKSYMRQLVHIARDCSLHRFGQVDLLWRRLETPQDFCEIARWGIHRRREPQGIILRDRLDAWHHLVIVEGVGNRLLEVTWRQD